MIITAQKHYRMLKMIEEVGLSRLRALPPYGPGYAYGYAVASRPEP